MKKQTKPASSAKASETVPVVALPTTSDAAAAGAKTFPIVGIGSSAGGLEALEQFLHHVPAMCGMAFVIVQHSNRGPRHLFSK